MLVGVLADVIVQCRNVLQQYSMSRRRDLLVEFLCRRFPGELSVLCASHYSFVVAAQYWRKNMYRIVHGT